MSGQDSRQHGTAYEPAEHDHISLIVWLIPLAAVIVLPGLTWVVAERPMAIRFEQAIWMTVGTAIVVLAILGVLTRGFRTRWRWSLGVTSVVALALFQWPVLTFAGRALEAGLPLPLIADVFPVMLAVGFLWVGARRGGEWLFAAVVGVGTVLVTVVLLVSASSYVELADPAPRGAAPEGAPDVVLLVLDGYTRDDVLSEDFGYDNQPFNSALGDLGFQVPARASANYGFTYASLAAMYELDYVYTAGAHAEAAHPEMRNALSGNPTIMDEFRRAGYEVAFVENAWQGSHCGAAVDICVRDGMLERTIWSLSEVTILAPVVRSVRPHPFNSVSLEHLESLSEIVTTNRTAGVPRLTIAHVILPHPPFQRDASCDYVNTPTRRAFTTPSTELIENRRGFYSEQLDCTNRLVLEAMAAIVDSRPDTIIMITGDHGSGSTRLANLDSEEWPDKAIRERMSIFSAYRLPNCDTGVYPTITPVNGARAVTSCALKSEWGALPDLQLWAPHDGKGQVSDVSYRLGG